jgi:hypothetical protein
MCTLLLDDTAPTCTDDCGEGDQPDEEFIDMCTACIAADNCDEIMMDDDGDDDDDFPAPECILDCGELWNEDSTPTEMCEFFAGDISCTDDCIGEDELMVSMVPIMCGSCVDDGNCDEIFEGDDGDEGDDGTEGGMPECWGDCPMSLFSSQTAMCEALSNGDISCMNDCTGEDAMFLLILPIMCGTCVADGNCDEIDDGE